MADSDNGERTGFSRREFLRSLAIGTVALGTGIDCSYGRTLEANNGRPLGIALLGLGRYAAGELGPALRQNLRSHPHGKARQDRSLISLRLSVFA